MFDLKKMEIKFSSFPNRVIIFLLLLTIVQVSGAGSKNKNVMFTADDTTFSRNLENGQEASITLGDVETHIRLVKCLQKAVKNRECIWKITTPKENQRIEARFHFDNIENKDCTNNYIEIRNGFNPDSPLIERLCGHAVPKIYSIGNEMLVKLVSDGLLKDKQIIGSFTSVLDECIINNYKCVEQCKSMYYGYTCLCPDGEIVNNQKQCIETGYSEEKGIIDNQNCKIRNRACKWRIYAPPDHKIRLKFTYFNLSKYVINHCLKNMFNCLYVGSKLNNGESITIVNYTGSGNPPPVDSPTNNVEIIWETNDSKQRLFTIEYDIIPDE